MAWDLRSALLKKHEFETARLLEFEFKQRIRTIRLLAEACGLCPRQMVKLAIRQNDAELLVTMGAAAGLSEVQINERWARAGQEAYRQVLAELGDPRPYPLA